MRPQKRSGARKREVELVGTYLLNIIWLLRECAKPTRTHSDVSVSRGCREHWPLNLSCLPLRRLKKYAKRNTGSPMELPPSFLSLFESHTPLLTLFYFALP